MDRAGLIGVSERVVPACPLGAAGAAVEARITEKRERVRKSLRIVGSNRVELQRVLTTDSERAVGLVTHTPKSRAVEELTAAAAVGVRGLGALRPPAILRDARTSIDQLTGERIDAGLDSGNQGPILSDWLRYSYPDLGLLKTAFSSARHRPREVSRGREGLIFKTTGKSAAQWNPLALIGIANINRSIKGYTAQRQAIRQRVFHIGLRRRANQRQTKRRGQIATSVHF